MALIRQELEVYYVDTDCIDTGKPDVVIMTDQRDQLMLERRFSDGFPTLMDRQTLQSMRYLAWAALKRTTAISQPFEDWDANVIAVEYPGKPEPVDPTQPTASEQDRSG